MFFTDSIPKTVDQFPARVDLLSRLVLPALATLIPAGITAVTKWVQDHSRSQRRVELSNRLVVLTKAVSEFPNVAVAQLADSGARTVLITEICIASRELAALQAQVEKQGSGFAGLSMASRVRAALLLYRPYGFLAWCLHIAFYLYISMFLLGLSQVFNDPERNSALLGFAVLGIPPLIIRRYASRLHKKHLMTAPQVMG